MSTRALRGHGLMLISLHKEFIMRPHALIGIRDLPVELLVTIFVLHVQSSERSHSRARTTLALVCRQRRRVSYETPSLWTKIRGEDAGARNSLALQTSRQCPLDVTFDLDKDYRVTSQLVLASLREACAHLDRWRTAELRVDVDTTLSALLERSAPALEEITLEPCGKPDWAVYVDLFRGDAPRLRSLDLSYISIPWDSGILSNLELLRLYNLPLSTPLTLNQILTILSRSPNLEVLALNAVHILPSPDEAGIIRLPGLLELELGGASLLIAPALFQQINAPNCHDFIFDMRFVSYPGWDFNLFIPLISPLTPFFPLGTISITSEQDSVELIWMESGEEKFFVTLVHPRVHEVLGVFTRDLDPRFFALRTHVVLKDLRHWEVPHLLAALDSFHVVTMDLTCTPNDPVLRYLSAPREGQAWPFRMLEGLTVRFFGGSVDNLRRMIEARHEANGLAGVPGDEESMAGDMIHPPTYITSLQIHGSVAAADSDRVALEDLVAQLVWVP